MPGNEVGDRIHNFFGQENLSQSQDLSQVVEGTLPGLGNNLWAPSQRQIATPFLPNLKNNIVPQSADTDGGRGSSGMQHGVNSSQSTLRPELFRGQFHIQQPCLNGYTHGLQMFQTRQNEANMFGMDSESSVRNFTSRGFSVHDPQSQLGNGSEPHKKNMDLTDYTESPVNFDFFGGQQQMVTQPPGMRQSFPRQQSAINDMQILQQQVMLKQIQEFQWHQQFQRQQVRQMTSSVQAAGNHPTSSLVNGIPVQDGSNYSWQQEHVPANSWLQCSKSPAMQGPSTGLMFSPDQGEVPCSVSMVSQLFDQSLHGSHISGAKVSPNGVASMQIDKPTVQQISGTGSSFSDNQFSGHPDQVGLQDGVFASRLGRLEKDMIVTTDGLGLNSGFGMEHLQLSSSLQNNDATQEFGGRQDLAGPSELSQDKALVQVPPLQKVATLDPTEERILFGSDDNLWDAFGRDSGIGLGGNMMLDVTEFSGTFSSMQSGSWSALMHSAVAETSGGNIGTQEEWSGLTFLTVDPIAKDQQNQTVNDVGKQQLSWTDNSLQTSTLNSRFFPLSRDVSGSSGQAGINPQGNVSAALFPGFPHSKGHLQIQHGANAGGNATVSQAVNMSFDRFSSDSKQTRSFEQAQMNQPSVASVSELSRGMLHEVVTSSTELSHPSNHFRDQKFPVLEAAPVPLHDDVSAMARVGVASKGFPLTWTAVPAQQRTLDGQPISSSPDMLVSDKNSSKISEPPPFNQQCQDQNMQMETGVRSESDTCLATQLYLVRKEQPGQGDNLEQVHLGNDLSLRMMNASQGKEAAADHLPGTRVSSTLINQDGTAAAAFGNYLQPNIPFHQNSSALHQVQGTENPEIDPYSQTLKKFKGAGATVDAQSFTSQGGQKINAHDKSVRDGSVNEKSIPTGESKMLNFSGKLTDGYDRNGPSDGIVALGRSEGQKFVGHNNSAFMRTEHSLISPQMAPSWFDQYGAFKNGQIVPSYDSQKMAKSKTTELPFTAGRSLERLHALNVMGKCDAVASNANHCAVVNNSSISMPIPCENFSSSQSLQPDTESPSFSVQRAKKRKSATSELVSWQKEVAYGCQRINNISAAEAGWAAAVNRLAEKVEDEADMVEDVSPVLRLKRRLILTTQLMQLLLCPPPRSILFANAFSNYDSVTHLVSRSTLGDACSTLCCSEINTNAPANDGNDLQSRLRTSQKISDQFFLKVMDDLVSRAMKLENELSRLDKRMSVLVLRVELQDLEKFAVINRFAKFHGRGQADVADSSSSDTSTSVQKYFLQRYVTAAPMPRNLPDRLH